MKAFKDILRDARLRRDLAQKDLAEQIQVVPAYISRMEKGFSLPSNELILKLCGLLDLDVREVYLQVLLEKTEHEGLREILQGIQQSIRQETAAGSSPGGYDQLNPDRRRVVDALVASLKGN